MIRKLTAKDKNIFMELTGEFYSSAAVMHPIPEKNRSAMFDELMRSNVHSRMKHSAYTFDRISSSNIALRFFSGIGCITAAEE